MADALVFHRLQFAFTVTYHYLFPQLTMGLALLIVIMKALRRSPCAGSVGHCEVAGARMRLGCSVRIHAAGW